MNTQSLPSRGLDRHRRAHRAADLAQFLLDAVLLRSRRGERGRRLPARHLVGAFRRGRFSRLQQDRSARQQAPRGSDGSTRHDEGYCAGGT